MKALTAPLLAALLAALFALSGLFGPPALTRYRRVIVDVSN